MIGKLSGTIDSVGDDWLILDVHGVGYLVSCSGKTLSALPAIGEAISLAIETYVREDQIRLFGFASDAERDWFQLLQSVQGVGAKLALQILGALTPSDLASAVALGDKAQVTRAPGVGPKVAQRIVAELKDKVPASSALDALAAMPGAAPAQMSEGALADAVSALTNLGYGEAQAGAAVAAARQSAGEGAGAEELIRLGLKELAR